MQLPVDDKVFHSLHCRGLSVDHRTGQVSYGGNTSRHPVAQFIGPKPLSEAFDRFSFVIVNAGRKCRICIGLCPRRYPAGRQPGWNTNSIGYHADNGGIYHETGHSQYLLQTADEEDVMECVFDFTDNTVTFLKNGIQVFTSDPLRIPPEGFYPIIGLHSAGEVVRLLELQPWNPSVETVPPEDITYHSLYCREARVSYISGIVRYLSLSKDLPVGQFISKCPLSPECENFSVEIVSLGQKSCISVGVCHRCYPSNCQPGWLPNSIAYHVDDGGIFHGSDEPVAKGPSARAGDIITCEFDFSTKNVVFRRNGKMVYRSPPVTIPPGGFHAAVGFHSPGEAVCLLEKDPWRLETEEIHQTPHLNVQPGVLFDASGLHSGIESVRLCETDPPRGEDAEHSTGTTEGRRMPLCCICIDKGVTRFLIPCGHTFCVDCIEEWITHHNTCPACRVQYQDVKMLYF